MNKPQPDLSKATARPWKVCLNMPTAVIPGHIIKQDDDVESPIALLWEGGGTHGKPRQLANAALIVQAVNDYDRLKAIEEAARKIKPDEQCPFCDRDSGHVCSHCMELARIQGQLANVLNATPESGRQEQERQRDYVKALEAVAEAAQDIPDGQSTQKLVETLAKLEAVKKK